MNQAQISTIVRDMTQKVTEGAPTTREDVERMAAAARASGNLEHRALYAAVRALLPDVPDDERTITADDVAAAGQKAKKTGRIEDRVAYVRIKDQFAEQEGSANQ
ncbi:hypothetical protein [Cohnella lupini]|uniref:Uncharacterized protein n=1 Tax=Cohnella lupini TaxID=1294267 RepID=A0A3D9I658_9BACL|nr:hypothetical protein [Cohnella lupini]RED57171.1 hypothetical protein DFP95_11185 [Cohnella lupini]